MARSLSSLVNLTFLGIELIVVANPQLHYTFVFVCICRFYFLSVKLHNDILSDKLYQSLLMEIYSFSLYSTF